MSKPTRLVVFLLCIISFCACSNSTKVHSKKITYLQHQENKLASYDIQNRREHLRDKIIEELETPTAFHKENVTHNLRSLDGGKEEKEEEISEDIKEEEHYSFVDSTGKTLHDILSSLSDATEKRKTTLENYTQNYKILFVFAIVIFSASIGITGVCFFRSQIGVLLALLNTAIWLAWMIFTIVKYVHYYDELTDLYDKLNL